MKTEEYKQQLFSLSKSEWASHVRPLLDKAVLDREVSVDDYKELEDISDDIYFERLNPSTK